jgi:hypothetical protein
MMNKTESSFAPPIDDDSRHLARGVVLHKGGDLSLQFSYRNRLGPWERRPAIEWAQFAALAPQELLARLKDPKGCWPADHLLSHGPKARMYVLRRDGVNGVPLAEHLSKIGLTEYGLEQRLVRQQCQQHAVQSKEAFKTGRPAASVKDSRLGPMSDEQVLFAPAMRPGRTRLPTEPKPTSDRMRRFDYGGIVDTLKGHCDRLGLNYYTVMSRIRGYQRKQKDGTVRHYPGVSVTAALSQGRHRPVRRDKGTKRKPYVKSKFNMLFGAPPEKKRGRFEPSAFDPRIEPNA